MSLAINLHAYFYRRRGSAAEVFIGMLEAQAWLSGDVEDEPAIHYLQVYSWSWILIFNFRATIHERVGRLTKKAGGIIFLAQKPQSYLALRSDIPYIYDRW